ncbi:ParM/StbA family protein [Aquisalimonas sp.]|uniref:ParM/StbA family protein n=1 Tax=Aquisalimonas sp. TaxID=1872621 RepID=UPI0025BA5A2F|nr:ParM/StbA family protein [Aquisalimonas sp.]
MERVIGLDMGYGFIKANDGLDGVRFPSVVGDGSGGSPMSLGLQKPDPTSDIRITVGARSYFLGDLAIRHSRIAHRGLSATRAEGDDLRILFLGALSLFCRESRNDFQVVTGLPPGRMHLAEDLVSRLRGDHTVTRHVGRKRRDLSIRLEDIEVVPQPLGTFWSEVLDSRGQLRGDSRLLGGRVGIIDVGFRTTDFATIVEGEYAPAWSRTVPLGISTGYDTLAAALSAQYGLERETYTLDQAVIDGQINVSGQHEDITGLRDQILGEVATKLMVELQSLWQLTDYDAVLLTGGGAHVLERYLRPQVPQSLVVSDPVTANARGYMAWGTYQSHEQQPEVEATDGSGFSPDAANQAAGGDDEQAAQRSRRPRAAVK